MRAYTWEERETHYFTWALYFFKLQLGWASFHLMMLSTTDRSVTRIRH